MDNSNRKAIEDTLYLCNFRVSVNGEWLCLRELNDVDFGPNEISEKKSEGFRLNRDPIRIERRNLVNISKLVVKELIDQSLSYGRMIDSDHLPLRHFFIILEHVFSHGLKTKKGLLGPRKELWDILQSVEKFSTEAHNITSSVRDLPTVRTHMGRTRAWIRIALMQKKLSDYIKILIDNKTDILADHYEPDAFILNEEMIIIIDLLIKLNVIDFNLCVKEEDLDYQHDVIDLSLYLRSTESQIDNTIEQLSENDRNSAMNAVLEQKNYIEELNRTLNVTISNLQTKVESFSTNNAFLNEDLGTAKKNLTVLLEENRKLKQLIGKPRILELLTERYKKNMLSLQSSLSHDDGHSPKVDNNKHDIDTLKKLEKELELQLCLRTELENNIKQLEKDNYEKHDRIVSLSQQLEDVKLINFELYKKLQECEIEINQKTEVVTRLQTKANQIGQVLNNLDKYNLAASVTDVKFKSQPGIPHSYSYNS